MILALMIIFPIAGYLISSRSAKKYDASATVQIQGSQSVNGPTIDQTTAVAARLIQTTAIATQAQARLHGHLPLYPISVSPDSTTGFITITAHGPDPQQTARVANAYAATATSGVLDPATQQLNATIRSVKAQLAAAQAAAGTSTSQNTNPFAAPTPAQDQVRRLSSRLTHLEAVRATRGTGSQIVQAAGVPGAASSPRPVRAALLALVIALLLALVLTALLENLDRRVRDIEELEKVTGLPLLTAVPRSAFKGPPLTPAAQESFARLRAALSYYDVEREVKSVMVSSPGAGEGKTLVSINLALAYARAGNNVILIEGDLRRPQIAARLGIPSVPGMREAFMSGSPQEALTEIPVEHAPGGRLRALVCGAPPPNPSELIASMRMRRLLSLLATQADVLVIDTSPLMAVADAVPLLQLVSGVVLVAQIDSTTHDHLRRAQQIVSSAGGVQLGVVAAGIADTDAYTYTSYLPEDGQPFELPSSNGLEPVAARSGLLRRRVRA